MEFLFNELSLHGQFATLANAQDQFRQVLGWRIRIGAAGTALRVTRALLDRPATAQESTREVVSRCRDAELRRLLIDWLAKSGPYWDEEPLHSPDDWFECEGDIVTGTGLAEAALAVARGHERNLVSIAPSEWERSPIALEWVRDQVDRHRIELENLWQDAQIERCLGRLSPPLASWADLVAWTSRMCSNLTLSDYVIDPLKRHPFVPGAARRFQELFKTLDRLKGSFGSDGRLTTIGMRIFQDHFVGEKAWFTGSSDTEKAQFEERMTFPHPHAPGERLFCPWHGKVKIQQMRVHFTYPITRDAPLYIVYVGPKITKR